MKKIVCILLLSQQAFAYEPPSPEYVQASVQVEEIQSDKIRAIDVHPGDRYSFDFQSNFTKQLTIASEQTIRGYNPISKDNYNTCDISLSGSRRKVYVGGRGDMYRGDDWSRIGHVFWMSMKKLEDLIFADEKCLTGACDFSVDIGNTAHEDPWYRGRDIQLTGYIKDYEVYMVGLEFNIPNEVYDQYENSRDQLLRVFGFKKAQQRMESLVCADGSADVSIEIVDKE